MNRTATKTVRNESQEDSMPRQIHLGPQHLVAPVVARLCREHLGSGSPARLVGGVGCGACWERAIRDDERAVVLFGLPREIESDPDLIDQIAVELACWGERVELTRAERAEVVRRQTAKRESGALVANRLGVAHRTVTRTRAAIREGAA